MIKSFYFLYNSFTIKVSFAQTRWDTVKNINVFAFRSINGTRIVIGSLHATLIQRPIQPSFYEVAINISEELFLNLRKLFFPNGTLRRYKWQKISNELRYEINSGNLLYINKLKVQRFFNKNYDLGFILAHHLLLKTKKMFTLSVVYPEFENASNSYERNTIRAIYSRLGYVPLEDGGDFPFDDFWYAVPENLISKSRYTSKDYCWNLPAVVTENPALENLLDKEAANSDFKSLLNGIKSLNEFLLVVVKKSHTRWVEFLISLREVNVCYQDKYGNNALHYCSNNLEMYEVLLKNPDIDLYIKNKAGLTPYDILIDEIDKIRSFEYAKGNVASKQELIPFYQLLHKLIPPDVKGLLMEGMFSLVLFANFITPLWAKLTDEIVSYLKKADFKPLEKKRIEEEFMDYFPNNVSNERISKQCLRGYLYLLETICTFGYNKAWSPDIKLPTVRRIMSRLSDSERTAVSQFFKEGGTMADVFDCVHEVAKVDSLEHSFYGYRCYKAYENADKNLPKVPHMDEDYEHIKYFIFDILLQN